MNKLASLAQIGRAFGARDGMLRLSYELQRGSGLLSRRMRSAQGRDRWRLERVAPGTSAEEFLASRRQGNHLFFFQDARTLADPIRRILGPEGGKSLLAEAEEILKGKLPFFGRLSFATGFPPNWFENPATGERVAPDRSWTSMRFASPDYGDLKFILEPSRFLFVYPLARAYAISGDERFAEAFWSALEDWARKSPPMSGPLWVCGQESSLRILAWSFGFYAFLHSSATTARRSELLLSMIAAHAWRAAQTLGYARSQRSNHLFSEAVGLWTAGTLYPELQHAAAWRKLGAQLLEEAALDQITPQGVHLQYSFNYQRMVLHLLLWTLRLGEICNVSLPAAIRQRAAAAFECLRPFVDPISGHAPNYGSNDGSYILPLSLCDYGDFRPLVQAGSGILNHGPALPAGVWDEPALWLCGRIAEGAHLHPPALPSGNAGYHRLGGGESWAMVRAGNYRRRPFQADQLHIDLWWKGLNLARDAGTYLYNGPPPWDNGLARSLVHNTITVDGEDQMRRAGRFLWLDWAQASGRSFQTPDVPFPDRFEGEHDGYKRLGISHRRSIQYLNGVAWVVVDDVLGGGQHDVRLHWLVADLAYVIASASPFQIAFTTQHGCSRWHLFANAPGHAEVLREGKSSSPGLADFDTRLLGWESPTYGQLSPAVSLLYRVRAPLPVRLISVILLTDEVRLDLHGNQVALWRGESRIHQVGLSPEKLSGTAQTSGASTR